MANQLKARPDKIFISVDESSGRSTISFAPSGTNDPIIHEQDGSGQAAMKDAKAFVASYPGCSIHGPHFHTARPASFKKRTFRRPGNKAETHE